jgi:hypothetical protein
MLDHLVGDLRVKSDNQMTQNHLVDSAIMFDLGDR